ncbi:MAG: 50S ribosomal protein L6 [Planctomycetota bacterium]|nr:MAG: 50S ribosomal protein L6 [Planctomycetota bacterium]REJ97165.1 MAG: 50S ribosomal protein L6 [Planctomycetota bacterium]REK27974.1 MAG: 50S ribosomal protein L6 [Planctomycetota bacterium]REK48708.1 MAG: 50S ribosomal protein L6 [Planctomycetota bacterium]
MSRIGKKPVAIPDKVTVGVNGTVISVEGPLGKLDWSFRREMTVRVDDDTKAVLVTRDRDDREARALHGLTRAIIQNMMNGVTTGFEKRLEVVGVGYVAVVQNNELQLRVGFANELKKPIPPGLDVSCPDQTHIVVKGPDKQKVGQFAAEVRALRKPEPYKGKGIRYEGEHVRRKAGKAVGA